MSLEQAIGLAVGAALVAGLAVWLWWRGRMGRLSEDHHLRLTAEVERRAAAQAEAARVPGLERRVTDLSAQVADYKSRLSEVTARLEDERRAAAEKLALLDEARVKMSDAFQALSAEALRSSNQSFLELARAALEKFQAGARTDLEARQEAIGRLVVPVKESLDKVDVKLRELETARVEAYSALKEQVKTLALTQGELKDETGRLVQALRAPAIRGRWSEIQLRRVVEMAGMLPYCDFTEQAHVTTEDGRLRPDMVVNLPGAKTVVVDAKAPLEAYLEAHEATDEPSRRGHLQRHARQINDHVTKLSSKAYWDQFPASPEFVVMFLPGETFLINALEKDPDLIAKAVRQRVIVASPTTLIALLQAVSYGWQQEEIARSAQKISRLGQELFDRLSTLTGHVDRLGRSLEGAVDHFNKAVGSLESRVLVSARKFTELGITSTKEITEVTPLEKKTRQIRSEGDETESPPQDRPDVKAESGD
jgi:DNA recombination protein RmuC